MFRQAVALLSGALLLPLAGCSEKTGNDVPQQELTQYAMKRMAKIENMRLFGTSANKDAVISFLVGNIHHLDMGTLLDRLGIAVRTGHHCAEPLMHLLGIEGTVRASLGLYNTKEEIDILIDGIERIRKMF